MRKNIFMLLLSLFLCGAYVTTNNNAKTTQENDLNKIMDRERKNTTTTFLSNDATYYFSNLTQNFAKNCWGPLGPAAAGRQKTSARRSHRPQAAAPLDDKPGQEP